MCRRRCAWLLALLPLLRLLLPLLLLRLLLVLVLVLLPQRLPGLLTPPRAPQAPALLVVAGIAEGQQPQVASVAAVVAGPGVLEQQHQMQLQQHQMQMQQQQQYLMPQGEHRLWPLLLLPCLYCRSSH